MATRGYEATSYTVVDIHIEEVEGSNLRVDYFDTKRQVREHVQREAEAARAAKEQAKQKKRQNYTGSVESVEGTEPPDVSAEPA